MSGRKVLGTKIERRKEERSYKEIIGKRCWEGRKVRKKGRKILGRQEEGCWEER